MTKKSDFYTPLAAKTNRNTAELFSLGR